MQITATKPSLGGFIWPSVKFNTKLEPKTAATQESENYSWILHPIIDLVFVCGGLVWLLTALMASNLIPDFNSLSSKAILMIQIAIVSLFGVPHGMATYFRVYDVPATRKASGMKVAYLGAFCLLLIVVAAISPFWTSVIGRLAICFSFQHGFGQAYGISLIYCYKRKYFLSKIEKKIYHSIVRTGVLLGVVNCLSNDKLVVLKTKLVPLWPAYPGWIHHICEMAVVLAVLATALMIACKYFRDKQLMPIPSILTIATAVFLYAFVLPGVSRLGGYFIVLYALANGLFHNPQYLAVTTSVHLKNQGLPKSLPTSGIATQLLSGSAFKYFVSLYSASIIFAVGSALIGALLTRSSMNISAELLTVAYVSGINLHHYFTDAIVWRLKDKDNLNLLLG